MTRNGDPYVIAVIVLLLACALLCVVRVMSFRAREQRAAARVEVLIKHLEEVKDTRRAIMTRPHEGAPDSPAGDAAEKR